MFQSCRFCLHFIRFPSNDDHDSHICFVFPSCSLSFVTWSHQIADKNFEFSMADTKHDPFASSCCRLCKTVCKNLCSTSIHRCPSLRQRQNLTLSYYALPLPLILQQAFTFVHHHFDGIEKPHKIQRDGRNKRDRQKKRLRTKANYIERNVLLFHLNCPFNLGDVNFLWHEIELF